MRETQLVSGAGLSGLAPGYRLLRHLVSEALVRLSPDALSRGRAFYRLQAEPGGSAAGVFVAWVEAQVHACMANAFSANAPSGR